MEEIFRGRKVKFGPKEDYQDIDTLIVTKVTKSHDQDNKYTATDKGTGLYGSYNDPLTSTFRKENFKFQERAKSATLLFAVGDKGVVGRLFLDGDTTSRTPSYSTEESLLQKRLTSYESERFTHAITVEGQRYKCDSKAVFSKTVKEKRNKYFFIANEEDKFHMTSKIHRYVCSPRKDHYTCQKMHFNTGRGKKMSLSLNGKFLHTMLEKMLKYYIMKSEGKDLFSLPTKVILPDFVFEQFPRLHETTVILRNQVMETPMMRIYSFRDWPNSSSVSAIRLASAGFFCQDSATETVECCSCDLSLRVSELGGLDPMTYHIQRSPDCVFAQQNANQELSHSDSSYETNEDKPFSDGATGFETDFHEKKKHESLATGDIRNKPMLDLHQKLNGKQISNNFYDAALSNWSEKKSPLQGTLLTPQNQNSSSHNISENIRDVVTNQNLERSNMSSSCSRDTSPPRFDISSRDNASTNSDNRVQDANGSYRSLSSMDVAGANINDSVVRNHSNQSSETAVVSHNSSANRTISYSNTSSPDTAVINSSNVTRGTASTPNQNVDYPPRNPDFKSNHSRQATFRYWQQESKPNSDDLAEAGFYFTGDADTVRCFHCDIGLADWNQQDDPWVEHARHSSECHYLNSKKEREFIDNVQTTWRRVYIPKHKHMVDYTKRLQTFVNSSWPRDYVLQTPQMIATAGFFYTGEGDTVRCHYCDGGLRQWEPHDDPWSEHAKWFPFCKFVIRTKGIEFIRNAATENVTDEPPEPPAVANTSTANVPLTISYEDQCKRKEKRNPMFSAAAESLKFCFGYSNTKIRNAINIYIERTGRRDFKGVDLVEIVLDKEEEGYSLSSDDEDYTTKPNNQPSTAIGCVGGDSSEEDEFQFSPGAIKKEYERLLNLSTCVICKSRERSMIYVPCGHRLVCEQCSADQYTCNHCKTSITQRIKTYFA